MRRDRPAAPAAATGREGGEARGAAASRSPARTLALVAAARTGCPGVVWVKRVLAFPIGERFAAISLTAALFSPRTTFIVLIVWGVDRGRLLARPARAEVGRDEAPALLALPRRRAARPRDRRARSRRSRGSPPIALVALGALPMFVLIGARRRRRAARRGRRARSRGWCWSAAATGGRRADATACAGPSPPALRLAEYAGILWIGALAGASSEPGRVRAPVRARLPPLRPRLPAAPPGADARPRGSATPLCGWDGRLLLGYILLRRGRAAGRVLRRRRPARGGLRRREHRRAGARFGRAPAPAAYDDEEDDGQ